MSRLVSAGMRLASTGPFFFIVLIPCAGKGLQLQSLLRSLLQL